MNKQTTLVEFSERLKQAVDLVVAPESLRVEPGNRERGRSTFTDRRGGGGGYSGPFAVAYDGTTVTVKGGVAYVIDQLITFEDTELTVDSFGAVVINFTLNASNVVIGTITTVSNLTASTAAVEQVPLATLVDGVLIQQQYGHIYAGGGRAW